MIDRDVRVNQTIITRAAAFANDAMRFDDGAVADGDIDTGTAYPR